jgi:phage-related protein
VAEGFLPPAVLDIIVNAAEAKTGSDEAIGSFEAVRDAMQEVADTAAEMSAGMGEAAAGVADAVTTASDAVVAGQDAMADGAQAAAAAVAGAGEAIGASAEAMAGTVAAASAEAGAAIETVADRIAAAAQASVLSTEPFAAYNEGLLAAAGSAGDLALAQAELKASSAEVKAAVADLAATQLTAGKDSDEYAAQLNVVADAMLREQDAAYQLRNAQFAAADATSAAGGQADAAAGQIAALGGAETEMGAKAAAAGDEAESAGGKASKGLKLWGLAALAGVAISVKMAGDFQQSMTRLVTSAGETQGNLATVSQGILGMSSATDTSTSQLASGMYMVESAGIHGASGLAVLKASAEGAQAEGASLSDVTNAMTSAINAYGMKAKTTAEAQKSANSVMNEMLQIVGQGKMTMQDLASSLSTVLPVAASYKISLAQVGGALATMTSMGVSARQGTQDLASTIRSLGNPTGVAVTEMGNLGVSSVKVQKMLGKVGLTGTIGFLAETVKNKMGPSGLVAFNAFNQSASAASDAEIMLKKLPPSIQGISKAYLDGKTSYTTWYNATKGVGLQAKTLADQFASTASKAHGFNSMLTAGNPAVQTFSGAMSKMLGGATGMNVALMLTGDHARTFNDNVKAIAGSAKSTGANINNWALIQKNFNFQLGSAEKAVQAMAISFGNALLPAATAVMHALASFGTWLSAHTAACKALAIVVGVLLAGALAHGLTSALKTAAGGFKDLAGGVKGAVGFFRGAEGEASRFGKIMTGVGNAAKSAGSVVAKAWSGTMSGLSSAWSGISRAASSAGSAVAKAWSSSMSAISSALSSAWSGITSALSSAWSGITSMASSAGSAIASAWSTSMSAIASAATAAWSGIVSGLSSVGGALAGAASSVAEFAAGVASQLAEAASATVAWIAEQSAAAATFIAENIAMAASATIAFIAENAATLGLVAGIALLIGAIIFLATHWKTVWHDITAVIDDAVSFIKAHWMLIVEILTGTLLIAMVVKYWADIKHAVLSAVDDVIDFVKAHWQLILSIITGPLMAVTLFVIDHWHQIESIFSEGVSAVIGFVEKLPGRIISLFASAGSWLLSAGKAVVEGLIHGIGSMAGAALHEVEHLGDDVKGAFMGAIHALSPSRDFADMGGMITAGLALGITSTGGQAIGTARRLGADVISGAKSALGISSPSKEFAALGEQITAGLALGINSTRQQAIDESRFLAQQVAAAFSAGAITSSEEKDLRKSLSEALGTALKGGVQDALAKGTTHQIGAATIKLLKTIWDTAAGGFVDRSFASGLAEWVKADNARLQALAVKRNAIAKEITAAKALASGTASAAESSYDLSSAATNSSGTANTAAQVISTLQGDVAQIRSFASNIRKLARMGLNKSYLSQLISMGPASGGALAAELASSGLGDIRQINTAESAITAASNGLGDAAVSAMYTAGKQSGAGFLAGLKAQEKAIDAVMASIAATMVARIRKDLGISSPSKVFFAHGQAIAQGLALGIASGVGQVSRAVGGLVAATSLAGTRSASAAGALNPAGGGAVVDLHLNLSVIGEVDKQKLLTVTKQATYRYNVRNSGSVTGILKPGA